MDYKTCYDKIDSMYHDDSSILGECWSVIKTHIAELEVQLVNMQEWRRWVPVTKKLPDNNDIVLVINYGEIEVGWYTGEKWINSEYHLKNVTFWRELPELPQETNNATL